MLFIIYINILLVCFQDIFKIYRIVKKDGYFFKFSIEFYIVKKDGYFFKDKKNKILNKKTFYNHSYKGNNNYIINDITLIMY